MHLSWVSGAPVRCNSVGFASRRAICPRHGKLQPAKSAKDQNSPPRRIRSFSAACKSQDSSQQLKPEGTRINKCFTSFASRRESDAFIRQSRVMINGKLAMPGSRVLPGDVVTLDDKEVDWERLALTPTTGSFHYVKHWKRSSVLCTTDENFQNNIIQEVKLPGISDRLFPVGRLDESSTGLILLTSDGRLPNAVLGAAPKCSKAYEISTDQFVPEEDLVKLREGIVITTEYRRSGGESSKHVSRTLPCEIRRKQKDLVITLHEGRNRQIRKMFGALGYTVTTIHRIEFMGITLNGLNEAGDSALLTAEEMKHVSAALDAATR